MSELREIRRVFQGLQTLYEIHIPKADPSLISDLLVREQENPKVAPMYTVEVFTKEAIGPGSIKVSHNEDDWYGHSYIWIRVLTS